MKIKIEYHARKKMIELTSFYLKRKKKKHFKAVKL